MLKGLGEGSAFAEGLIVTPSLLTWPWVMSGRVPCPGFWPCPSSGVRDSLNPQPGEWCEAVSHFLRVQDSEQKPLNPARMAPVEHRGMNPPLSGPRPWAQGDAELVLLSCSFLPGQLPLTSNSSQHPAPCSPPTGMGWEGTRDRYTRNK